MDQALSAGVRFFQYRDKTGSRRSIYETCMRLATIARNRGAVFIVNDHPDIAVAVDAAGVHLGQDDLPIETARKIMGADAIIGISTHSSEEAKVAEQAGADYIGFGPVYRTLTKDVGKIQGVEALRRIKRTVSIPVIAIGGINHENCRLAMEAGADGVAVISAILGANNPADAARRMIERVSI